MLLRSIEYILDCAALGVIMAIILFSFRTAWIATATLSSRQTPISTGMSASRSAH